MKLRRSLALLLGCTALLVVGSATLSGAAGKPAKAGMSMYLVMAPHTSEECLTALDEFSKAGPKTLAMWDFGCGSGDHTGYCMVKAASEEEALSKVPAEMRDKAKAVKVNKFTAAQIAEMHKKM